MRSIETALRENNFQSAHDRLVELLAEQPDFVEALRLCAATKQALGNIEGAELLLRKALALDPNWAPTLGTLGELLLTSARQIEGETLLRRAATRLPRSAFVLARHYNDTQRANEAYALMAPLCAQGQADAEHIVQFVIAAKALGCVGDIVAHYRRLRQTNPDDALVAQALAIALDGAGQAVEAERIAEQSLARGNRNAVLFSTQAHCLIALGEFERAEAVLQHCLRLEPQRLDAHDHLARLIWMRTGDAAQATAPLDAALRRFPHDVGLQCAKAAILQGAGDARMAYECLSASVSRAHAPAATLVRAGLAALDFDPALSLPLAKRALDAMPDNASARSLLVASLLGTGNPGAALRQCEQLRNTAPDDQYFIALQTDAWRLLDDPRYREYCDHPRLIQTQTLDTPETWPDLPTFLIEVRRSLDRMHARHAHPLLFQSLRHGTETTDDLSRSTDPVIAALFALFDAPIRRYIEHIRNGPEPLRRRMSSHYRYNGSWSVRLRSSGYHVNHVHPRGWISSACYLELPDFENSADENAGCLTFGQPGFITKPALCPQHIVRPRAGTLVLFPSYFWHGTVPFSSTKTRLTVAFDVVPVAQP